MAASRRHPNVVNVEEVEPADQGRGNFGFRKRRLGAEAGGVALGCSHLEVAPGKTAFPFHFHSGFEEALFILEGEGAARIGQETVAVRAGDYVVFPPGPSMPHALTNSGSAPLRYLRLGRRSGQRISRRGVGHEPDQGRSTQARLLRRRAARQDGRVDRSGQDCSRCPGREAVHDFTSTERARKASSPRGNARLGRWGRSRDDPGVHDP
jgi:uncharacterized cupin superfamily protein